MELKMLKAGLHGTGPMTRNLDTTICLINAPGNKFEAQKNEDQKGALESIYNHTALLK